MALFFHSAAAVLATLALGGATVSGISSTIQEGFEGEDCGDPTVGPHGLLGLRDR